MKAISAIAAFFIFLCCAHAEEAFGWEDLITHTNSEGELRAMPTITVRKIKKARVYVRVENRTGVDIEYSGYSKETPQIFIKEKHDGKWVATRWNWCGAGMSEYVVKSQKSITFQIENSTSSIQVFTIFRNWETQKNLAW